VKGLSISQLREIIRLVHLEELDLSQVSCLVLADDDDKEEVPGGADVLLNIASKCSKLTRMHISECSLIKETIMLIKAQLNKNKSNVTSTTSTTTTTSIQLLEEQDDDDSSTPYRLQLSQKLILVKKRGKRPKRVFISWNISAVCNTPIIVIYRLQPVDSKLSSALGAPASLTTSDRKALLEKYPGWGLWEMPSIKTPLQSIPISKKKGTAIFHVPCIDGLYRVGLLNDREIRCWSTPLRVVFNNPQSRLSVVHSPESSSFKVTWHLGENLTWNTNDWIGFFSLGSPYNEMMNVNYSPWVYVNSHSGSTVISGDLPSGYYVARYLAVGGFHALLESPILRIEI